MKDLRRCDHCNKLSSNVRLIANAQISHGVSQDLDLCPACIKAYDAYLNSEIKRLLNA